MTEKIRYKGSWIFVDKFGSEYKAYIPYGNLSHIEKTKTKAISNVKRDIDSVHRYVEILDTFYLLEYGGRQLPGNFHIYVE